MICDYSFLRLDTSEFTVIDLTDRNKTNNPVSIIVRSIRIMKNQGISGLLFSEDVVATRAETSPVEIPARSTSACSANIMPLIFLTLMPVASKRENSCFRWL